MNFHKISVVPECEGSPFSPFNCKIFIDDKQLIGVREISFRMDVEHGLPIVKIEMAVGSFEGNGVIEEEIDIIRELNQVMS